MDAIARILEDMDIIWGSESILPDEEPPPQAATEKSTKAADVEAPCEIPNYWSDGGFEDEDEEDEEEEYEEMLQGGTCYSSTGESPTAEAPLNREKPPMLPSHRDQTAENSVSKVAAGGHGRQENRLLPSPSVNSWALPTSATSPSLVSPATPVGDLAACLTLVKVKTESDQASGETQAVLYRRLVVSTIHEFRARVKASPPPLPLPNVEASPNVEGKAGRKRFRRHRPDLTVCAEMVKRIRSQHNNMRSVGVVDGIQVGDLFGSRAELVVARIHCTQRAGIDCTRMPEFREHGYIAVAVVMMVQECLQRRRYLDDSDDGDLVDYSGQGGRNNKTKEPEDQKLLRGNLGLSNACKNRTPVRLVRGYRYDNKVMYSYDGLYLVDSVSYLPGLAGKMVYKFRLRRIKNQKPLKLLTFEDLRSSAYDSPDLINSDNLQRLPSIACAASTAKTRKARKLHAVSPSAGIGPAETPQPLRDFPELLHLTAPMQQQKGVENTQQRQVVDSGTAVEEQVTWDFSDNLMLQDFFHTGDEETVQNPATEPAFPSHVRMKSTQRQTGNDKAGNEKSGNDKVGTGKSGNENATPNPLKRPMVYNFPSFEAAAKKRFC